MPAESRSFNLGDSVKPASGDAIRLYHFTALEYLDSIMSEGITRGDLPLGPTRHGRAVWLTRNPSREAQTWTPECERLLTAEDRAAHERAFGTRPPPDAKFADKRAVLITVDVPSSDRLLYQWLRYARLRGVKREWLRALNSSPDWYIYRGAIPPEWFVDVEAISDRARALFAERLGSREDVTEERGNA